MENVAIVGEELTSEEKEIVEKDIETIVSCGMTVLKVLNFRGGSIKYIANMDGGGTQQRKKLESKGWSMGAPYYSKGTVAGFKLFKTQKASDVNAWGD